MAKSEMMTLTDLVSVGQTGYMSAGVFVEALVSAWMRVLASAAQVELLTVGQIGSSCE